MTRPNVDLPAWVNAADDSRTLEFRQAVHTILYALESLPGASAWLALKGAVLLSLRYGFTRMTKDVDLSTFRLYRDFDLKGFLAEFSNALTMATEALPYGLACRVQSHKVEPPGHDATYQSLHMKTGYAPKADARRLQRLMRPDGASTVVTVDLSFNEPFCNIEILNDGGRVEIPAYALTDFIAEKLRAMLQQEVRNRTRPQDALDLLMLLKRPESRATEFKDRVLSALRTKSEARELSIDRHSMRNPQIRKRSEKDYATLADQISIELPPFDTAFEAVIRYYESLPWPPDHGSAASSVRKL